ncbi:hypothetical protein DKM19_15305 [Streptosporangium sp. 'caverna']|nr:hypothetical protein DKM19_15305 [Streptosporangium sp. 'caverna']
MSFEVRWIHGQGRSPARRDRHGRLPLRRLPGRAPPASSKRHGRKHAVIAVGTPVPADHQEPAVHLRCPLPIPYLHQAAVRRSPTECGLAPQSPLGTAYRWRVRRKPTYCQGDD